MILLALAACSATAQTDAPWDGQSLADEAVWFSGLLSRFGDEEILPVLPLVYGTGTCPECGKEEPYWTWLDRFMKDY